MRAPLPLTYSRKAVGLTRQDNPHDFEKAILDQAEAIASGGRVADGVQPSDWRLRGMFYARRGDTHKAIACLKRAAAMDRLETLSFLELGDALCLGRFVGEAIGAYLHAVRLNRDDPAIWRRFGEVLIRSGHCAEAIVALTEGLRLHPADAPTHSLLGDAKLAVGEQDDALKHYEESVHLAPADARGHAHAGREWLRRRDWVRARACFQRGIDLDTTRADCHAGLGRSLFALGRIDQALVEFSAALALDPVNVEALQYLVLTLESSGRVRDASSAWLHLGLALDAQSRWPEAIEAYRQALVRKPDNLRALVTCGALHVSLGDAEKGIPLLTKALTIDPELFAVHVQLSRAYHLTGDYVRGWEEFGWWHHSHAMQYRSFEQPVWNGSPVEGQTILLWSRPVAGLGDDILFLRYAQHVKSRGATVIFECPRVLLPLAERIRDIDRVVVRGSPLPRFDIHCPIGLIPVVLRRDVQPFVAEVPYASVDEALVSRWRQRLQPVQGMTVGLCWGGASNRGDARYRFAPLADFAALGDVAGLRFISLQVGHQAQEVLTTPAGFHVESLLGESPSIADTAALISNLDLVITVDTMVAHLAGALAANVWTVLPRHGDWRWLRGDTTPWYPTMRLFRQSHQGNWREVVARMRAELDVERPAVARKEKHAACLINCLLKDRSTRTSVDANGG